MCIIFFNAKFLVKICVKRCNRSLRGNRDNCNCWLAENKSTVTFWKTLDTFLNLKTDLQVPVYMYVPVGVYHIIIKKSKLLKRHIATLGSNKTELKDDIHREFFYRCWRRKLDCVMNYKKT